MGYGTNPKTVTIESLSDTGLRQEVDLLSKKVEGHGIFVDDYGAKADGVTDDTQAFIDAFTYAKGKNLKVLARGSNYYLSNTKTINVYNSADFGGAKFTINDLTGNGSNNIFSILHDNPSYTLDATTLTAIKSKFVKSTTRITELAGLGNIIVYIYDNTKKQYIREGGNANSGVDKFDQITIDDQGYITTPLTWDFDNVTSILIQKMDDDFIEFGNATFISSNDVPYATASYINKGIKVNRSNVVLSKVSHRVASEASSRSARNGFLSVQWCANVTLRDTNLQPLKIQSDGTYEFGGSYVINLLVDRMNAQSDDLSDRWGVMGTNFFKNLTVKNSKMNRIDSHMGLHNLTVDNCELGTHGITVVGFGDLIINDSKFYGNNVIGLRGDYGSFWNGNIYAKNIYHRPLTNAANCLINVGYKMDWDYGLSLMLGTGIISVENYTIDNLFGESAPELFKISNSYGYDNTEKNRYTLAKSFVVKNVEVVNKKNNAEGINAVFTGSDLSRVYAQNPTVIYPDGNFLPNVQVTIDNVDFMGTGNPSESISNFFGKTDVLGFDAADTYASDLNRLFIKFKVYNGKRLYVNLRGMYAQVHVYDSIVRSIKCYNNGCRAILRFTNCVIRPLAVSYGDTIMRAKPENLFFTGCTFTKSYYQNDTAVGTNFLTTNYEFLKLGSVGTTASVEANLSGCVFDPSFDFATLRSDINLTDFRFGNNHYAQKFPLKKGTTAQRPPAADIRASFMYYDTSLNKPVWFDGTNWKDSAGTTV